MNVYSVQVMNSSRNPIQLSETEKKKSFIGKSLTNCSASQMKSNRSKENEVPMSLFKDVSSSQVSIQEKAQGRENIVSIAQTKSKESVNSKEKASSKRKITGRVLTPHDFKFETLKAYIQYFTKLETDCSLDKHYLLRSHLIVRPEHRNALMLWLCAIEFKGFNQPVDFPLFELSRMIDLYLSRVKGVKVLARDLQAIAISCLHLFSKLKQSKYLNLKDVCKNLSAVLSDTFPESSLKFWMISIANTLHLDSLTAAKSLEVTSKEMYTHVADYLDLQKPAYLFGLMILEASLIESKFLRFSPSLIGFSCACLIGEFCQGLSLSSFVCKMSDYFQEGDITICAKLLAEHIHPDNIYPLLQDKYQQGEKLCVGKFYLAAPEGKAKTRASSLK